MTMGVAKMLRNPYQMLYELQDDDLYFLSTKKHFQNGKLRRFIENKFGLNKPKYQSSYIE